MEKNVIKPSVLVDVQSVLLAKRTPESYAEIAVKKRGRAESGKRRNVVFVMFVRDGAEYELERECARLKRGDNKWRIIEALWETGRKNISFGELIALNEKVMQYQMTTEAKALRELDEMLPE